ncbi:MAG: DEAD/DEAH box helicase [Bacteroidales bacterium]|nr:DEAD/DEAH box helicase [Bacteroidales bacterium]
MKDTRLDDIALDTNNPEFMKALDRAMNTSDSFFLTGKAGTGKTTFLKYLQKVCNKEMVVLAPTGVAAINAGGQTIHSFFQIPPSVFTPNDPRLSTHITSYNERGEENHTSVYESFRYSHEKKQIIRNLRMIVIDEVSMVRADILDAVDKLLKAFRDDDKSPFGGVQMIFIGDVFQLPPVVTGDEANILYRFYKSEFFFSAQIIKRMRLGYIEMQKIYRQSDRVFIDLLNRVRENLVTDSDFRLLKSITKPSFVPPKGERYIVLATTNATVDAINEENLNEIDAPETVYTAVVTGEFSEKDYPADFELRLRPGAQVIFLRNDKEKRYFNGKIGTVAYLKEDTVTVSVEYDDDMPEEIAISREEWNNVRYNWNISKQCIEEEIIGTFKQFPLRLAWAVTVHKSQRLTFERVMADIGDSFTAGQVYVALSRCRSLDGLVLTSVVTPSAIKTDHRAVAFIEWLKRMQIQCE